MKLHILIELKIKTFYQNTYIEFWFKTNPPKKQPWLKYPKYFNITCHHLLIKILTADDYKPFTIVYLLQNTWVIYEVKHEDESNFDLCSHLKFAIENLSTLDVSNKNFICHFTSAFGAINSTTSSVIQKYTVFIPVL